MNNLLISQFEHDYKSNRLTHAFLVCNTFYELIENDLKYILSNYFFDKNINLNDNPDIYYVKPINGTILKDDILKLRESFMMYSMVNKNKVYIIQEVEKMNLFAANSLLKFLEEPSPNIFAILITSNINEVLPTIRSRCQVLMVDNKTSFSLSKYSESFIANVLKILTCFETDGYDSISEINNIIDKKIEKEDLKSLIKIVKYFYRDCLNYLLLRKIEIFTDYEESIKIVSKKNTKESLTKKLFLILKEENNLIYNLNTNLFLDNLLIKLECDKND